MAWSQDEISKFEDILSKLTSESHMLQLGSDNGVVPVFSLVNEINWALPAEPMLAEAVEAVVDMLQPMLDDAQPFNEATIEALKTFARWCSDSLDAIKADQPIESYLSAGTPTEAATPSPTASEEEPTINFEAEATPTEKAVIAFEPTFEEPASVGNENWPDDLIQIFAKSSQQFSAELLLAEKDNDEGMLPVYSLLKDFESDFSLNDIVRESIVPVLGKMDALLDAASAYDNYAIQILTEFNIWLEAALTEINSGRDPITFAPTPDTAPTAEEVPVEATSANASDEAQILLTEFAEFDVVMDLNMEENEELLTEFQIEAVDHLGQIESAVLEFEQDVTNEDAIASMFRSFHTIKGVAGFLNLIPVNRLAHEIESMMDLVRNNKLTVFTGVIDLILEAKDTVTQLIDQITEALASGTIPTQVIVVSKLMARARWAMEGEDHYLEITGGKKAEAVTAAPEETSTIETDDAFETTESATTVVAAEPDAKVAVAAKRKAAENASIRVNTWKLDNLMDMVGELVIVQSQLLENAKHDGSTSNSDNNSSLQRNMSQLTRITKELQHTSMALRMIPIKQTFQKMGRIVRDLSAKCGKQVRFDVVGEDTELDRNVVEEIGDPLVHMIRNALDHGLETPEKRVSNGKDATGNITLKAYHQGSSIVIELVDDGNGIDPDIVLRKAIANGIVSENDHLSNEEIYKLIFAPGFSTAAEITDISGRGVGMDVVKKNIEKLRGKVEIESELGKGSIFKILLPLTMAIVDGLVVKVGNDRFILPTTSVKVALRPDENVLAKVQGNQEILNIRGKVIPLFRLHQHFAIPEAVEDPKNGTVVIVETADKPFGLLVDDMVSKQEVVIKSLGGMMQGIAGVSGGAILGDGTIALILDPAALIGVA